MSTSLCVEIFDPSFTFRRARAGHRAHGKQLRCPVFVSSGRNAFALAYIRTLELHETKIGHETDFLDASETLEVILDIGLGSI